MTFRRAAAVTALVCLAGCRQEPPLPEHGLIPGFELTAQTGQPFASAALAGRVWIADFIFANCPGPCPRMSSRMRRLQKELPGVSLVSFTVDPERDTPAALAEYATRFQADTRSWHFLTGPKEALHRLSRQAFMLGDVDGRSFEHSTRFVLVDGRMRIRGFYQSEDQNEMTRLLGEARRLAEEAK
ncbi:MAG: SCO family protein [Acidobacteria bacterium]|nr:SCO family protein [Acidobacteriota bacterium]